ncbi:glycosyltransferase [Nocardioides carbamazepini]|uniref:glycosyltransferase family 4 protein n=1 Tax=Nocardioides carbamazepini TaxID=2854259 RepID=UPI002149AFA4|nr:glycosyltransferase [Nocardioides carbamazepini]MCR1781697.1 glycosyltransferase [Nocardioides carbamazepini]
MPEHSLDPPPPGEQRLSVVLLHWGRNGAGPRFTYELGRALRKRTDLRVAISHVAGTEREAAIAALDVRRLAVKTYTGAWGAILGLPRLVANVLRFRRFLRAVDADVVVTSMYSLWHSLAISLLLPRRTPLVVTVHDATPHVGDDHIVKLWARATELRRANAVVALSETVAAELRQRRGHRLPVFVTVHGAFGDRADVPARSAPRHDPPVLGFFGRILPYKGLDLLVAASTLLAERGVQVVTRVHGDGSVPGGLVDAGHAVAWEPGWVSEELTNQVVDSFDVLVLPYREASQSGVLSIALSEGVPVVATPVGGLAEQVDATGCGVVASAVTPAAVATAVAQLLSDTALYAECSRRGLASASSDHGWDRVAADYAHAVAEAVGR